ncbi:MAG: oxygen-dependent coproporphyrinogen oxidase [Steroidobacteraceae bacterium]|jgi:coproporphyrinogen III oxidase
MDQAHCETVYRFLRSLQDRFCRDFESVDGAGKFLKDHWERAPEADKLAGLGTTAVLELGAVFERAGVALSDVSGTTMPAAATARNPQLAGRAFRAMGVSVVMHPLNPNVPSSHLNVRYFQAGDIWWFGGGFDLTPYLIFEEDVVLWHRTAASACEPFHERLYPLLRANCDEYFFMRHRGEARGLGGLFYDDLNEATPEIGMSWELCFDFMQSVARGYLEAYLAILRQRRNAAYGERERQYQLYRRGRYVEFNLLQDRGTLFGLQSGGRADAILISMPPTVHWSYRSPDKELDARLLPYLTTLRGRDWIAPGRS